LEVLRRNCNVNEKIILKFFLIEFKAYSWINILGFRFVNYCGFYYLNQIDRYHKVAAFYISQ